MTACGETTNMFQRALACERERGHKGRHQQPVTQEWRGEPTLFWATWSTGGGAMDHATVNFRPCHQCGVIHDPDNNAMTKGRDVCFTCWFWESIVAEKDKHFFIDGYCHSWGAAHGSGGATVTVTDANGTVTRKGLWTQGKVPWEFRDRLPDTAAFGGTYPKAVAG